MKKLVGVLTLLLVFAVPATGQQAAKEAEIKAAVPFSVLKAQFPGLTLEDYNRTVREVAQRPSLGIVRRAPLPAVPHVAGPPPTYLGRLGGNRYAPDSTANPYGAYGNPYAPNSLTNPYGSFGSPYSPKSPANPYATNTPRLLGQDGRYLGKLSTNPYDPDSVSNPYGRYGSPYSPDSITNPYGRYGSPYSPLSPTNPFTSLPPLILGR